MSQVEITNVGIVNGDGNFSFPYDAGVYSFIPFFNPGTTNNLQTDYSATPNLLTPAYYYRDMWLRFVLPIDAIDTINSAYIKLRTRFSGSISGNLYLTISAHLDVDSGGPSDLADAYAQAITNGSVTRINWQITGSFSENAWLISPDIGSLLAELITQVGWSSGNHIVIYLWIDTTLTDSQQQVSFCNVFNPGTYGTDSFPRILIDYTDGIPTGSGYDEAVESDLNIEQSIAYINTNHVLNDDVTIDQDISYAYSRGREVNSDLSFDQDIVYYRPVDETLEHVLLLNQTIEYSTAYSRSYEDTVTFEQLLVRNTDHNKQIVQGFLTDELDITQDIAYGRTYYKTLNDYLTITQDIHETPIHQVIEHTVLITHDVDYVGVIIPPKTLDSILTIDQTQTWSVNSSRIVDSDLTILQTILAWKQSPGISAEAGFGGYYQGEGPDIVGVITGTSYTPVNPTITQQSTMVLSWPVNSPSLSLTIRSPLFGNQEILDITRIQRETRGGTPKILVDPDWPISHRTKYNFDGFTDTVAQNTRDFFLSTLGLEIKLVDYEGTTWYGYVINPSGAFGDVDNTTCDNTAEFEFDGVRQ